MAAAVKTPPVRANGKAHQSSRAASPSGLYQSPNTRNRKTRGFFARCSSLLARLAIWATILTILFRCPSSLEECNDESPLVCKYYFQARDIVSPHVTPYYTQYAAPYVDIAKPYYRAVDSHVLTPTRGIATRYAAPWVKNGQKVAWDKWETTGQPQMTRLIDISRAHYYNSVAPPLAKAGEALSPYYDAVTENSLKIFHSYVLPSYQYTRPYAIQSYVVVSEFTTGTAVPVMYWACRKTRTFLDTAVWPQVRVLYAELVEPQLLRIGERLGRHKGKAKTKVLLADQATTTGDEPDATDTDESDKPHDASNHVTHIETPSAVESTPRAQQTQEFWHPVQAPPPGENESERRRKAREMVIEDLESWQNKFVAQADEGAIGIDESVEEIARKAMEEEAEAKGKPLLQSLKETADAEIANLKRNITSIVGGGAKDAQEQAIAAVRAAGVAIKKKAQMLRSWREEYDTDLELSVTEAADVHFEILDETRSLALQHIGMKWAWAEGVTYKDWAKYHELKKTLSQWTDELKVLITSHPTLLKAQEMAARLEDEAMEVASKAAAELGRLKEVAHWKIVAGDSTDNFDTDAMRLAAEAVSSSADTTIVDDATVVDDASIVDDTIIVDTTIANSDATVAATSDAAISSADVAASMQRGTSAPQSSAADEGHSSRSLRQKVHPASEIVDHEVESTGSTEHDVVHEAAHVDHEDQRVLSSAPKQDATKQDAGDQKAIKPEDIETLGVPDARLDGIMEDVISSAEALDEVISTDTSNSDDGDAKTLAADTPVTESVNNARAAMTMNADHLDHDDSSISDTERESSESEDEYGQDASSKTKREDSRPEIIYAGAFGAAAQSVPNRQPIMDDGEDSDMVAGATNAAQEAYSSAVSAASKHYSSALSVVSAQIYGTPKPVHQQLLSSVSAAYDNAIATASNRLDRALNVVSSGVYAQPTPASKSNALSWEKVESIAAERLSEGRLWADVQYQSALIALGLAEPTPTSTGDKLAQQAKANYYAGLGVAQERYMKFLSAASSAWDSATAGPTPTDLPGSASSLASVAGESAASAAREAEEAAKSAYSAATAGVGSAAEAVESKVSSLVGAAEEQVYSAGAAIGMTWETVLLELSSQIYGQPTPIGWYDGLIGGAESCTSAGKETAAEAVTTAQEAVATASAEAARQVQAVRELVSELIGGKEAPFTQSVLERLERVYATAGSLAGEATASVKSVASKATDAVKDGVQQAKDEL